MPATVQTITPCDKHWVGPIPTDCPDCDFGEVKAVHPLVAEEARQGRAKARAFLGLPPERGT